MTGFLVGAAIAVVITLLLLLRPFLWRGAQSATASHLQLNAAIYRDQFAELERDRSEGVLGEDDYQQARMELQRRVLEDGQDDDVVAPPRAPKKTLLALGMSLPLAAVALYLLLGSPAGLNPPEPQHRFTSEEIERMVAGLAAKLEKEPDNLQGWAMLARSYKAMRRPGDAEKAFERAWKLVETDAQLLADYADLLASGAGGKFDGRPLKLIEKALQIDPNHSQALWLSGSAAFDQGRFDKAVADWERLLKTVPADSEDAQMISANIAEARARAGKPAVVGAAATVRGQVDLAAALKNKAAPDDVVMVVAREAGGPRAPVAVLRARVADLPLAFVLDDSMSVMRGRSLSAVKEVEVEVRISKTGMATPEKGDLLSPVQKAAIGSTGLKLLVDHIRP